MSAAPTSNLITVSNAAEGPSTALAYYQPFYQKVTHLAVISALAVVSEAGTVDNHADRKSFALQFLAQCSTVEAQVRMAQAVCADLTITNSSTSQVIADRLALIWDKLSGV